MTGPSVTLPTFSEFAGGVRLTLTWPGRAIKEAGSMLLRNSKTCRFPPLAFLPGCLMTGTGVVTEAAGDATSNLVIGAASLISWAVGGHEPIPEQMNPEFIDKERQQEGFEADRIHVAVCGHTGSGKSSVINALRGIHNSHGEAAPVGTSETTISRGTYYAHRSMPLITLHDIPGAGTRRTPLDNYYDNQKLYLFDLLLVVHSERVGTIDIDVIKGCIRNRQAFIVLRSKSDNSIRSIVDDCGIDEPAARTRYIQTSHAALREEFEGAGVPRDSVDDIGRHCVLVNGNSLRKCVLQEASSEINEMDLVRLLVRIDRGFHQADNANSS